MGDSLSGSADASGGTGGSTILTIPKGEGLRYNDGKLPISMCSTHALRALAEVSAYGATKYARDNWRKGLVWTEVMDSALRHILAWLDREEFDEESGVSHLSHALWNIATLIDHAHTGGGQDDRYQSKIEGV